MDTMRPRVREQCTHDVRENVGHGVRENFVPMLCVNFGTRFFEQQSSKTRGHQNPRKSTTNPRKIHACFHARIHAPVGATRHVPNLAAVCSSCVARYSIEWQAFSGRML